MGGYQLKVGGVVVGSWAGGAPNRNNINGNRVALAAAQSSGSGGAAAAAAAFGSQFMRYPINMRGRVPINGRLQRTWPTNQHITSLVRTISRNTYGNNKVNRNRNRNRNRKNDRKTQKTENDKQDDTANESDTIQDSNG